MRLLRLAWLSLSVGCTTTPTKATCRDVADGSGPRGTVPVKAEPVVSGLEVPWGIAFLPDGAMLVTERPGRVRRVDHGRLAPAPVATLPVNAEGEGGLLGIEPHPDFASNRFFYLYLTQGEGDARRARVERWVLAQDGASASKERDIFTDIPGAQFHDGGRIRFGPDGMLYIGTGDAREPSSAQDRASTAGKLLRVTAEGAIPGDNPLPGSPVFLLGLRNTQGFDWRDAQTLLVTDHGPSGELLRRGRDEVTVARRGQNLGWPEIHGCETKPGFVSPSLTWKRAVPPGGAAVYTGSAIGAWKGDLMVASLGATHLHRVRFRRGSDEVELHEVYFENELGRLREARMGPDGHLYLSTSNCDGRGSCGPEKDSIVRIVPAG